MARRHKEPTWTLLVEEALRERDDFMDYRMLEAATGGSQGQVSAACFSLRKFRVVDVIINPDGHAWWYALPKDGDTRLYKVKERSPEVKPRKPRKSRKTPV